MCEPSFWGGVSERINLYEGPCVGLVLDAGQHACDELSLLLLNAAFLR